MNIYVEWIDSYTGCERARIYQKIDPDSINIWGDELSFVHLREQPGVAAPRAHTIVLNRGDLYYTTNSTIIEKAMDVAKIEGHFIEEDVIDIPRSALYGDEDNILES